MTAWNAPTEDIVTAAQESMPQVISELKSLVSYPSLAFDGYDLKPGFACAEEAAGFLRAAGVSGVEIRDIGGRLPLVWAEIPGPVDAPTVLLYAHYDVQPAPVEEQGWHTDPFTPTLKEDGRLYGRGAADDKSGVAGHLATLRILGLDAEGRAPLNIKICFEGEEECDGSLEQYVAAQPELFAADVYIFSDGGNLTLGKPAIESAMRGSVAVDVHIRTIAQALHSGLFGGAAPDAFVTLSLMLKACYDEQGNTCIPGIEGFEYEGFEYPEDLLRRQIAPLEGVDFAGSGAYASRLWSRPSLTVIGLDMPSIAESSNIIIPEVRARLSLRIPPKTDAHDALEALKKHLRTVVPFGAVLELTDVQEAEPFSFEPSERFLTCAEKAFAQAFGEPLEIAASGGSIPLLTELQKIAPQADFLTFGAEDVEFARIHGGNESVDIEELRKVIVTEVLFLQAFALASAQ